MQISQQLVQNFKQNIQEVRKYRLLMELRSRHNAESSQWIKNSRQTIGNTHNDLQLLASIITERFDNTLKDQSNYYLRKESKKECREGTTQNKADEPQASL